MVSSVSQSTLDHLARRLDELAAEFPTQPEAVDPVTLADDIATLSHHLQHAVERAQERFAVPDTVHAPERLVLVRLARATAGMAHALDTLAEALAYATTGFQREAVPDLARTHLRNDPRCCGCWRPRSTSRPAPGCAIPPPTCAPPAPSQSSHATRHPADRRRTDAAADPSLNSPPRKAELPPNPPAQITVAYSRHFDGLIAIAHGEKWPWAHTALEQTGFTKRDDGSFHTPGDSVPAAMAKLLPIARRHRATVQVSGRPYLGDVADQIAARLPGRWTAQVEIYSNPLWQEDLLPYLWDRGDLARAVKDRLVPYAAKLDSDTGIELLLTEHSPDPEHGYLIGALASYEEFEDSYDNPHAPASIPPSHRTGPGRAGHQGGVPARLPPRPPQTPHGRRPGGPRHDPRRVRRPPGDARFRALQPRDASALAHSAEEGDEGVRRTGLAGVPARSHPRARRAGQLHQRPRTPSRRCWRRAPPR
ncbi:hypothetical protein O1M63_04505 [Streptomyces mirabilis]|nr:hypothetical protein [Streptomyces mirabilis]